MELKKGYKQTEVGIIPNDWKLFSIQQLTPQNRKYTIVDGPFGSNLKTIHYRKSGIPIITSGYVTDGRFNASEYLYVDIEKFKQERRSAVRGGDIVMAKIGERCGASAILPKNHPEGILSGNALKISIDESEYSTELISQILWWHHVTGKFELLRTTGAQPAISMANLKTYKIPIPPNKSEQTAIATALSDADALITSLEKLIAKKKLIKQGAMQELLKPKKGWVVKKLGEIIYLQGGYAFKSELFTKVGVPIIRISDVGNDKVDTSNSVFYAPFNIPKEFIAKRGDALIAMSGATTGKIGVYENDTIAYINQRVGKFVVLNKEITSQEFVSHIVRSERFKEQLTKEIAQGAQPNISGKQIQSIELPIPNDIDEQCRIAEILTDLYNEISMLEIKLEKCKAVKQGMMQNLLTGKIRLI